MTTLQDRWAGLGPNCFNEKDLAALGGGGEDFKTLWKQSVEAEQAGKIKLALEIYGEILALVGESYVICLRAGWLHYRACGYNRALYFLIKALLLGTDNSAPLYGMMNCYIAKGDAAAVDRMAMALRMIEEKKCFREQGADV